ncbi:hypothetical protein WA538_005511 [Blastocystis sp. DL]
MGRDIPKETQDPKTKSKPEESEYSEEEELDTEEEETKVKERMDQMDKEVKDLDETAQKRIRNLEFAADRYLWFPDPDSTEKVRCRCCPKKHFNSMQSAIEHLKTRYHKHQARHYVMDNCKEEAKVKEAKKDNLARKQKWLSKKAKKQQEKRKEKTNNLTVEEIEQRKKKFQEKKARRLARKQQADSPAPAAKESLEKE